MSSPPPLTPKKPSWLTNKAKRVYIPCAVLMLLVIAAGGYALFPKMRAYVLVRQTENAIDRADPNWKLDELEARRADVPESENSALVVLKVDGLLPHPLPNSGEWDDVEGLAPRTRLSDKQLVVLRSELEKDHAALIEARKLADLPRGRFPVQWKRTAIEDPPTHVALPRGVAWLLHVDVLMRTAKEDFDGALVSSLAAWNTGRSFGDEPLLRSQRERVGCMAFALQDLEHVVQRGEPSPDAVKPLIAALLEEDKEPVVLIAWRGERAALHAYMEARRAGEVKNQQRVELSREEVAVRALEVMTDMIEIAKGPFDEQTTRLRDYVTSLKTPPSGEPSEADATALSQINSLFSFRQSYLRLRARARCAAVALAAEGFRRTHQGQWPQSVDSLVPEWLAEIPLDPFDGKPLRYQTQAESIIVYSVGSDGVDDGGRFDSGSPYEDTDIGIRLWNVKERGLPPRERTPRRQPPQRDGPNP